MNTKKKLTLLHSNDMHGDFMAETVDDRLVGGVSMLSGYLNRVRHEEKNVLYVISGDMFRGSLIDSEFKGISTIEIMNMLTPDVATLGNHEVDYGVSHLLFLEKCARFPIINANMYIKTNHVRLFQSHKIIELDGMKILFIGILTEEVLAQTKKDQSVGTLIDVREAVDEVGKICDSYQTEDIDFTVLLTHIGIEKDKELAALLDPRWGIDVIIGGHSHTYMEQPEMVAGIPIVQAASGTDQVGRFDLVIDTERNTLDSFTWNLIPIEEEKCPRDEQLEEILYRYKNQIDLKYDRYLTRFFDEYTHRQRNRESDLGKLFADVLQECSDVDLILIGSGSFRRESMGPIVRYRDLVEMFPYDDELVRLVWTGKQLKQAIRHIFRPEALEENAHTEFYQYSGGIHFTVSLSEKKVDNITFRGAAIEDDELFTVGVQSFHYLNMEEFFGLSSEEVKANKTPRVIATKTLTVIDEYLSSRELVTVAEEARWETIE